MLNTVRIKFLRGEVLKYISHLDLIKTFQRALKRTRLPISYSKGFNPHPQIVFGLPLSVGVSSQAEYADIEMEEEVVLVELIDKLNNQLPDSLKIIDAKKRDDKDNIMALITAASYDVLVKVDDNIDFISIKEKIEKFLEIPEKFVKKQTKKGIKEVNIAPMIYKLELWFLNNIEKNIPSGNIYIDKWKDIKSENTLCFSMLISAGSKSNLKPELLMLSLSEFLKIDFKILKIHRTALFIENELNI